MTNNTPSAPSSIRQRNWLLIIGVLVMIVGFIGIALLFRSTIDQMVAQTQTAQPLIALTLTP